MTWLDLIIVLIETATHSLGIRAAMYAYISFCFTPFPNFFFAHSVYSLFLCILCRLMLGDAWCNWAISVGQYQFYTNVYFGLQQSSLLAVWYILQGGNIFLLRMKIVPQQIFFNPFSTWHATSLNGLIKSTLEQNLQSRKTLPMEQIHKQGTIELSLFLWKGKCLFVMSSYYCNTLKICEHLIFTQIHEGDIQWGMSQTLSTLDGPIQMI